MKELRTYLNFTQVRFHCRKHGGRTFHIATALNSKGEAAVQYLSDPTHVKPDSCGSYLRMNDDDSFLTRTCNRWGKESGQFYVGKWGHGGTSYLHDSYWDFGDPEKRLFDNTAFVAHSHHWLLGLMDRWECDDFKVGVASGDFWKVFVR